MDANYSENDLVCGLVKAHTLETRRNLISQRQPPMKTIENVVVERHSPSPDMPTIQKAASLADSIEAQLTIIDNRERLPSDGIEAVDALLSRSSDKAVQVELVTRASSALRTQARKKNALLVVKEHLSHRLSRWFFEPDSEWLIRHGVCPTLILRSGSPWPPRRILCLSDLTVVSIEAFKWAATMARQFDAEIVVMNANRTRPTMAGSMGLMDWTTMDATMEREFHLAHSNLGLFLARVDLKNLRVVRAVGFGRLSKDIAAYVDNNNVDLVVMGNAGDSSALDTHTTLQALRSVRCSFLTVPLHPNNT